MNPLTAPRVWPFAHRFHVIPLHFLTLKVCGPLRTTGHLMFAPPLISTCASSQKKGKEIGQGRKKKLFKNYLTETKNLKSLSMEILILEFFEFESQLIPEKIIIKYQNIRLS